MIYRSTTELRILLHAPTPASLARNNAANLAKGTPHVSMRIVINADAVLAALDAPDVADTLMLVCPNTLAEVSRDTHAPLTILTEGAVPALARMQLEGWSYVRA